MATETIPSDGTTADPVARLEEALRRGIVAAFGPEAADADPAVRPAAKPEFGDFQANFAMTLAKRLGKRPRDVAEAVIAAADLSAVAEPPEIAGPGFINLRLRSDALVAMLEAIDDASLGVRPEPSTHAVVIDLCAVNVAKQMHVGHLRSTIIGDALARVFERIGRDARRENHLGDWGLPIAMVLHRLREAGTDLDRLALADLDEAYRAAQASGRGDARGLEAARRLHAGPHRIAELEEQNDGAAAAIEAAKRTLVALQSGDEELVRDWRKLIDVTLASLDEAVSILGVRLGREHERGESFYRDRLERTVADLVAAGIAAEDDGAIVVRFPDRERGMIVRKSDGGFLYATTDVAAVRYRTAELDADRVIYVVDARQRDHFRDVFETARMAGWDRTPDGTAAELVHIGFGSVLGADRKPLKTRAGRNVTLRSLLDEACERGTAEVRARAADPHAPTHGLPEAELAEIGRAVGIAAIKYADLSNDLVRDYVFDMDRMIAFEGDTGPYLQYAHARINSIFLRAEIDPGSLRRGALRLEDPAEKRLALVLLRYGGVVADVARSLEPHRLCQYLYQLAGAYSAFYQACPVLKAPDEPTRDSRLRLCGLVGRVLADGLGLLGIEAPHRM